MSSDIRESSDVSVEANESADVATNETGLSDTGLGALQGFGENDAMSDAPSPARKGSDFEKLANEKVFTENATTQLDVPLEINSHLDPGEDEIGLTHTRRIDTYYQDEQDNRGEIWELKSGYEKNTVDLDQALEYTVMRDAGSVWVHENGQDVEKPVDSVNYLFETQAGAEHNATHLYGTGVDSVWYFDEQQEVQLQPADSR